MPTIQNVAVGNEMRGCYSLSWNTGSARYHVWLDAETLEVRGSLFGTDKKPALYKNPLVDRNQPGHFKTRHLDATAKSNAWMVVNAIDIMKRDNLIEKAKQAAKDKEAAEEAEQLATRKRQIKQKFGPLLYDVLKTILTNVAGNPHFPYALMTTGQKMLKLADTIPEGEDWHKFKERVAAMKLEDL